MANRHPSAIKRNRQNAKRRARGRAVQSRVRLDIRKVREALGRKDLEGAEAELRTAIRGISKAASKGMLHRNAAARRISRLSKHVAALKSAG